MRFQSTEEERKGLRECTKGASSLLLFPAAVAGHVSECISLLPQGRSSELLYVPAAEGPLFCGQSLFSFLLLLLTKRFPRSGGEKEGRPTNHLRGTEIHPLTTPPWSTFFFLLKSQTTSCSPWM